MKQPAVYILANAFHGTLYIGVTSHLVQRIWQHKQDLIDGFTRKYAVHRLVYFERHADMTHAITREKQLKKWNREWKIRLIEQPSAQWRGNPHWQDLYDEALGGAQTHGFPPSRE